MQRLEQSEAQRSGAPAKANMRDRGTSAAFSLNSSLADAHCQASNMAPAHVTSTRMPTVALGSMRVCIPFPNALECSSCCFHQQAWLPSCRCQRFQPPQPTFAWALALPNYDTALRDHCIQLPSQWQKPARGRCSREQELPPARAHLTSQAHCRRQWMRHWPLTACSCTRTVCWALLPA